MSREGMRGLIEGLREEATKCRGIVEAIEIWGDYEAFIKTRPGVASEVKRE